MDLGEYNQIKGKKISENLVENRLVEGIKNLGGKCWKFVSPGMVGVPDRIVLMPGGQLWFVELKAPGKYPKRHQTARHDELRYLGFRCFVFSDYWDVDKFLTFLDGIGYKPKPKKGPFKKTKLDLDGTDIN